MELFLGSFHWIPDRLDKLWDSRGSAPRLDLFSVGSGNPGATNVKRTMGAFWGNTVFILDCVKRLFLRAFDSVFIPARRC